MTDEDQAMLEAEALPAQPSTDDSPRQEAAATSPDDGLTPRERRERRLALKRLRQRERRLWIGMIVAGLVVLVVFMRAFWPVMAGRLDAVKQVDEAQALLERAKPTVDGVDKVVAVQLSPRAAAGTPDTTTQILIARRDLKQALALLDAAWPKLADDEQKRGALIRTALKARLDMVDSAPAILAASVKAVKAKGFADQGWAASQAASAEETAAAQDFRRGSASSEASASAAVPRVSGQLGDARTLYGQAVTAFPAAGFDQYVAYIDLRLAALKLLAHGTRAWLQGDVAGAAMDRTVYDRTAAKAAAAAAKLPPAPSAAGQGFRNVAGSAADTYTRAKKQAVDADKALGEY